MQLHHTWCQVTSLMQLWMMASCRIPSLNSSPKLEIVHRNSTVIPGIQILLYEKIETSTRTIISTLIFIFWSTFYILCICKIIITKQSHHQISSHMNHSTSDCRANPLINYRPLYKLLAYMHMKLTNELDITKHFSLGNSLLFSLLWSKAISLFKRWQVQTIQVRYVAQTHHIMEQYYPWGMSWATGTDKKKSWVWNQATM